MDELVYFEHPEMAKFSLVIRFIVMKIMSMTPEEQKNIALIDGTSGLRTSVSTMMVHAMGLASEWRRSGMRNEEVVTIMMDNCTDYYIPVFAAWLCGAGVSLSDPDLSYRTLARQVKLTGSRVLVASTRVVETALEMQRGEPGLEIDIYTIGNNELEVRNIEDFYSNPNREFKEDHDHKIEHTADDIAAIFWSSGTTGEPKGIPYHQKYIFSNEMFTHTDERSPSLITTCLFHVVGFFKIINFLIVNKQSCIFLDPSCSASDMLHAINDYTPVRAIVQPFHLLKLLTQQKDNAEGMSLDSLQDLIPIGAPIPTKYEPIIFEKFKGMKAIKNYYGMTELGVISLSLSLGCIGKPVPGTEVKIIDPDTGEVQVNGQVGEICVRKKEKIKSYINSEVSIWGSDGWAHTGDLAYMNDAGDMVFVDRIKGLIKFGGKHVQPAEIENLLTKEPFVKEAAVFGVPDSLHQEMVTAVVVLTEGGATVNLKELQKNVNTELDEHKQIRGGIFVVADIPRNTHGKVLKQKLIAQCANGGWNGQEENFVRNARKEESSSFSGNLSQICSGDQKGIE